MASLYKRKILQATICLLGAHVYGQIGINTDTPKSTLEVVGKPTESSVADGIIIPRITGDQLAQKSSAYSADQTGTLIYAIAPASAANLSGTTENVSQTGFYFFNGTKWERLIAQQQAWELSGNAADEDDFIGTTNIQPIRLKVNGNQVGEIGGGKTYIGEESGAGNGVQNTAFGTRALKDNQSGSFNSGFGYDALRSNTTGTYNSAIGNYALMNNTGGYQNVAIGHEAMKNNSVGVYNYATGTFALINNKTGSFNVAVGGGSLMNNIHGSYNVVIGNSADVTVDHLSNATAIGANAKVGASNSIVLGGKDNYAVNVGINTTVPSNKLHVVADPGADPVRFQGLQNNSALTKVVMSDENGVLQNRPTSTILPVVEGYNLAPSGVICNSSDGNVNNCSLEAFTLKIERKSLVTFYVNALSQIYDSNGNQVSDAYGRYYGLNLIDTTTGADVIIDTVADVITDSYSTGLVTSKLTYIKILEAGDYTFRVDSFIGGGNANGARRIIGSNNAGSTCVIQPVQ